MVYFAWFGSGKECLQLHFFQRYKKKNNALFYFPEECHLDLLYKSLRPELFLYWRVSVFLPKTVFSTSALRSKATFRSAVKIFWIKNCISVRIKRHSVYFTGFTLISQQKSDCRRQFMPLTFCLIFCCFEFIWSEYFSANRFQTMQSLYSFGKNSLKESLKYIPLYIYIYSSKFC